MDFTKNHLKICRPEYQNNLDKQNNRIAVVSILVTDRSVSEKVNGFLSEYGEWILGRMGIPYREKGINIISLAVDAPQDVISAVAGKIGRLPGVSVKTAYAPAQN